MKRLALLLALALSVAAASSAAAQCYADYKATRDPPREKPVELHYGVIALPAELCNDPDGAEQEIRRRIRRDGWRLLVVDGMFGPEGLGARREDAGEYYLRY